MHLSVETPTLPGTGWGNVGNLLLFGAYICPTGVAVSHDFTSSAPQKCDFAKSPPSPPPKKKSAQGGWGFPCIWGSLKANPHPVLELGGRGGQLISALDLAGSGRYDCIVVVTPDTVRHKFNWTEFLPTLVPNKKFS